MRSAASIFQESEYATDEEEPNGDQDKECSEGARNHEKENIRSEKDILLSQGDIFDNRSCQKQNNNISKTEKHQDKNKKGFNSITGKI